MVLFHSSLFAFLQSTKPSQDLDFLPQELTAYEITAAIFVFVWRQFLYLLGLGNDVSVKDSSLDNEQYVLPEIEVSMPLRISKIDLKKYKEAVGAAENQNLFHDPAQICLFLSSISEPAMLLLLGHNRCPVRPLGSVNVRNKFELFHPSRWTQQTSIELQVCEVQAKLVPETRKVKRGLEIDIQVDVINLTAGAKDVLFRQTFTMLQFMRFRTQPMIQPQPDLYAVDPTWLKDVSGTTSIHMTPASPRAWAAICKDYNPIHISTLAAKLFGFPNVIAHGNHALALALASRNNGLQNRFVEAYDKKVRVEVQFRRPIVLPTKDGLRLKSKQQSATAENFWVLQGDKICITASVNL